MRTDGLSDVYSLHEVARAAEVSQAQARAVAGTLPLPTGCGISVDVIVEVGVDFRLR